MAYTITSKIKQWMNTTGVTQSDLCIHLDMSAAFVSRCLAEKQVWPVKKLTILADLSGNFVNSADIIEYLSTWERPNKNR